MTQKKFKTTLLNVGDLIFNDRVIYLITDVKQQNNDVYVATAFFSIKNYRNNCWQSSHDLIIKKIDLENYWHVISIA